MSQSEINHIVNRPLRCTRLHPVWPSAVPPALTLTWEWKASEVQTLTWRLSMSQVNGGPNLKSKS